MALDIARLSDPLSRTFLRGTLPVKLAGAVLQFGITVILTRSLSEAGFGLWAFAFATIQMLALFCSLGLDRILVRDMGAMRAQRSGSLLMLWKRAARYVLLASFSAALVLFCLVQFTNWFTPTQATSLLIALPLLVLLPQLLLMRAGFQGTGRAVLAQFLENIAPHAFFLILILSVGIDEETRVPTLLMLMSIALLLAIASGTPKLWQLLKAHSLPDSAAPPAGWLKSAPILMAVSALGLINTRLDIILLALLDSQTAAGYFTAATRYSDAVNMILVAGNAALLPAMVLTMKPSQRPELEKQVKRVTQLIFGLALPVGLVVIIAAPLLLSLFGEAYQNGSIALQFLCAGVLFSAFAGPVGYLLMMSGHEARLALILASATLANLVLDVLLIPHYGLAGAAFATALAMIAWNAMMLHQVIHLLNLNPAALGKRRALPHDA